MLNRDSVDANATLSLFPTAEVVWLQDTPELSLAHIASRFPRDAPYFETSNLRPGLLLKQLEVLQFAFRSITVRGNNASVFRVHFASAIRSLSCRVGDPRRSSSHHCMNRGSAGGSWHMVYAMRKPLSTSYWPIQ